MRGDDDIVATVPETSTPPAIPKFVVELLVRAPIRESRVGWSSMSAAAAGPVIKPTDTPCTMRATMSQVTSGATARTAMLTASSASPARMTGRRPIASESRPRNTSGMSTARQYTA